MAGVGELACTDATLILHNDGITITAAKINTIVQAVNLKIDSYWPGLFANLLEKRNVEDPLLSCGSGGGGGAVAVAAAAPAAEEKQEEAKEESDDGMGFSLFD